MVDVMRGAIAEVEDYARVSVATRSQAALAWFGRRGRHPPAGRADRERHHAVAALLPRYECPGIRSPNGFVIEVEDRGLGMSRPGWPS